ncbi:MAG: OmpH family outer membrane protein [Phycisphaerae bacterium]|nr:OmpH family outer membrane protein [Phycisphaerae bacterium]
MRNNQTWRWALVACGGLIGVGLLNLSLTPAEARRPAAADKCCVATLDLNGVLGTLDEREVREKELQAYIQTLQSKLDDLKKQAQQAQEDLKILPERTRDWKAKREEAIRLAMRLEGEDKLSKALVEDERKKLSLDLFTKIKDAAARFAQREGYLVVFSNDSGVEIPIEAPEQQVQAAMVGRRVLYRADGADISQAVSQMMNTEFKAR